MVGEEDQRLPVGRHLDRRRAPRPRCGSSPASARVRAGPASRAPTRLLIGLTVYAVPSSASTAAAVNQSSRGPSRTAQDELVRRSAGRAGSAAAGRPARSAGPSGSSVAGAQRRRAEPGQRVGRPAAEHRRRPRSRRRPRRTTARRAVARPTSSTAAGRHVDRPPCRPADAVDRDRGGRARSPRPSPPAGSRSAQPVSVVSSPAAAGRVADQRGWPGAAPARRARRTAARRGARTRAGRDPARWSAARPGPPPRLDHAAHQPDPGAGREQGGGSRSTSKRVTVGAADQPPAAGRARSDRCRRTAPASATEPAGTRGRGVASRGTDQLGRQPGQVREAGREAAERDAELGAAEPLDRRAASASTTSARRRSGRSGAVVHGRDRRRASARARRRPAAAAPSRRSARPAGRVGTPSSSTVRAPGTISIAVELAGRAAPPQLGPPGLHLGAVATLEQQRGRRRPAGSACRHLPDIR